jgi:predicted dehydrogenase
MSKTQKTNPHAAIATREDLTSDAKSRSSGSRRDFLKRSCQVAAATAVATGAVPHVHAAEDNTIRVALVGCGSRGTGAVAQALQTKGPIKLWAMADLFSNRLESSLKNLSGTMEGRYDLDPTSGLGGRIDVPPERRFIGFDAYRKAIDCLKPGDLVVDAAVPGFRWVHFRYAIEKGINYFMEKSVAVDGPTCRRMLELARKSVEKNLKVAVGLQTRHCRSRRELLARIQSGEIGEIIAMRAYGLGGAHGPARKPEGISELLWQIQNFPRFFWTSGGGYCDYYVHQVDECCWMKGAWPISVQATGGRHYPSEGADQNLDNYAAEYTFPDGAKLHFYVRMMSGCHDENASYAHGTKGCAVITAPGFLPGRPRIYRGQSFAPDKKIWSFPPPEPSPYQMEMNDLVEAIRQDKPYNEAENGTMACLAAIMGRMAAHTGKIVTRDEMLSHTHEFAPGVDKLTLDSPSPLPPRPDGTYPGPQPGLLAGREY